MAEPVAETPPPPVAPVPEEESPFAAAEPAHEMTNPRPLGEVPAPEMAPTSPDGDVFDVTYSRLRQGMQVAVETGDAEPMAAAHDESPFEESPVETGYSADAFAIEDPAGLHVENAPLGAEVAAPLPLDDEPSLGTLPRRE